MKSVLFFLTFLLLSCEEGQQNAQSSMSQMDHVLGNVNAPGGYTDSPTNCPDKPSRITASSNETSTPSFSSDGVLKGPSPAQIEDPVDEMEALEEILGEEDTAQRTMEDLTELIADYQALGGERKALLQALCFHRSYFSKTFQAQWHDNGPEDIGDMNKPEDLKAGEMKLDDPCNLTINNQTSKNVDKIRLFHLNLCTGEVHAMKTANSKGGINAKGSTPLGGSNEMPSGFFLLGGPHEGERPWSPGRRLHGLEVGKNENSSRRLIAFHRAVYGSKSRPISYVPAGRNSRQNGAVITGAAEKRAATSGTSHGCTAVNGENFEFLDQATSNGREPTVNSPGSGSLFYVYGPHERKKKPTYCGSNLWLKP